MSFQLVNPLLTGAFTRVLLELRWGDMDAYGHINNVTQMRLLEEARVRAFGSPTADRDAPNVTGPLGVVPSCVGVEIPPVFSEVSHTHDILVTSHAIEYRAPIPYREGPVAIDTVISKVAPVVMTVGYVIAEPDGSKAYTVAETDVVFVDRESGRAQRLQEEHAEALRAVVNPGPPMRRRK